MSALLEVVGVDKTYHGPKGTVVACHDVTLTVDAAEVVGLVGESGSGKSTVASIALGLVNADAGTVRFKGRDQQDWLAKDRIGYRAGVQAVFQHPRAALDSRRQIGWSLIEPMVIHKIGSKSSRERRVEELLHAVDLDPALANRRPHQLSGGQLQRVNIARALSLDPELLICDEPVSALDVSVQAQVLNLLEEIRERTGVGMLFISHDLGVVRYMCDRLVVMYAGRVVEEGGVDAIRETAAHPYTRALLSAALEVNVQRLRSGPEPSDATVRPPREDLPEAGCQFAPRCDFVSDECREGEPPLVTLSPGRLSACRQVDKLPPIPTGIALAQRPATDSLPAIELRQDPEMGEGAPMRVLPYGAWSSALDAKAMGTTGSGVIAQLEVRGTDVIWTKARPGEGGRTTLMMRSRDGVATQLLPEPYDVGTRVHEFGGRAFAVGSEKVWFSHLGDDQIYVRPDDGSIAALTSSSGLRFADFSLDERRGLLYSVVEDHTAEGEPRNYLARVATGTGEIDVVSEGADFYAAPRLSPDGTQLAWVRWFHPHMPWDETELWLATLDDNGDVVDPFLVAGGGSESVHSPRWSSDGRLHFLSDREGAWTLYRFAGDVIRIGPEDEECGGFIRILNNNGYDLTATGAIWYTTNTDGVHGIARYDVGNDQLRRIETPFTYVTDVRPYGEDMVGVAATPEMGQSVVLVRPDGEYEVIDKGTTLDPTWVSRPESITFPTSDGFTAQAFLYRPANPKTAGVEGEQPPLIVNVHGGPVWAAFGYYQPEVQFFTSHGYAYLDVNYRGSVGWGRAFRRALYGNWGIADVDDVVNGARHVVGLGAADGARVAVRGPSAGGWTTLAALAFSDYFAAGMSSFGVADPERFVQPGGTHKYESRYLWSLIAPYPEGKSVYEKRSPLGAADRISKPLLLLQGLEDMVVLPEQSRVIADRLLKNGVPVELIEFPREGHGFRESSHIEAAFAAELAFLRKVYRLDARGGD